MIEFGKAFLSFMVVLVLWAQTAFFFFSPSSGESFRQTYVASWKFVGSAGSHLFQIQRGSAGRSLMLFAIGMVAVYGLLTLALRLGFGH
jgi:hypothetical protein